MIDTHLRRQVYAKPLHNSLRPQLYITNTTLTQQAMPNPPNENPPKVRSAKKEVLNLTTSFLSALNRRDFKSQIWEHMTPDLSHTTQNFIGCTVGRADREGCLERYSEFCKANPQVRCEVIDSHVAYSKGEAVATVFTVIRTTGLEGGGESEANCAWTWERLEGRWRCVRTTSMHGASGMASEP